MKIIDKTKECDFGLNSACDIDVITGITVHHFGVDGITDAVGIAKFYRANPEWTGGKMPYTFIINDLGYIEQALPLRITGPHALRWSEPTISIVYIGTFDKNAPLPMQYLSGCELAADICSWRGIDPFDKDGDGVYFVEGHTFRPNATKQEGKVCPGKAFDMDRFRSETKRYMKESAIQRMVSAGIIA